MESQKALNLNLLSLPIEDIPLTTIAGTPLRWYVLVKRWANGATFYFVLEELNLLDKLHGELFDAIHAKKKKFRTKDSFIRKSTTFNILPWVPA
jgi:hypothetical protein